MYGRKFYNRKRYGKTRNYKSRALSTRRIFGNRSAYSQAVQINALRRRVNKVYKVCKPETKINYGDTMDKDFSNSGFSGTWESWFAPLITVGAEDNQRVGDKVYRKDIYKFSFTYSNNAQGSSGLHNGETSCAMIRVIMGIWKEPKAGNAIPSAESVIHGYGSSASAYNVNILQPLANGITAEHKILKDTIIKLDLNNPVKIATFKTPYYLQRYDQQGYNVHSWIMLITGDLDWDSSFTEEVECHGVRKTVFKDA